MPFELDRPDLVRYLAAGTMGEPEVLRALTDVSQFHTLQLPNHGLRMQLLDDVRQPEVREDLHQGWNVGRGVPFYGATTLVPSEDDDAIVHVVEIPEQSWQESVRPRLEVWNYHPQGWFSFHDVQVPTSRGLVACITEMLPPDERLQRLDPSYRRQPDYRQFVTAMEQAILRYRREVEGSLPS